MPKHRRVILFDIDNTLLDNDAVVRDLRRHLRDELGTRSEHQYFELFEEIRSKLGYADYLGALQRYRIHHPDDPEILKLSTFLLSYPFKRRLFPKALQVLRQSRRWGLPVVLSDGDAVFQPYKARQSGIWAAVRGHVLIFIHKEKMLEQIEKLYPAYQYVLVDDKLRILDAVKRKWKDRVTTVFVQQGHYATDSKIRRQYPEADLTLRHIRDFLTYRP
jgi:FMN phosphatase YigB (HAD superfamily)